MRGAEGIEGVVTVLLISVILKEKGQFEGTD